MKKLENSFSFIYEKCAKSGEFYFGRRCVDCEKDFKFLKFLLLFDS